MKRFLIPMLAICLASPIVSLPSHADAQVLVNRQRPAPRPPLSAREETRLYAAQDKVSALSQQIAELETAAKATPQPTPEQTTQLAALRTQMAQEQQTIDRLEAKRDRRS